MPYYDGNIDGWQPLEDLYEEIDEMNRLIRLHESGWGDIPEGFGILATEETDIALVMELEKSRPVLKYRPRNLLAAIRLQFAKWAALGNAGLRECKYCGDWFTYGSGTDKRETAHYCQPKCQNAHAYKKRKGKK